MRITDCVWGNSIPEEADYHLCERAGWIMMDCKRCNVMIMAATHLDLFNWIFKAEIHYKDTCQPIEEELLLSKVLRDMRILCGYNGLAKLKPETHRALSRWGHGYRVDFIDVSAAPTVNDRRTAYWRAIRERWTGDEDLVTVEQDNVIREEILPSFAGCGEDWCSYMYYGSHWLPDDVSHMKYSLGCTKFSAKLQRQIPADAIAGDYMAWFLIDERFMKLFRMHGFMPHVHGEVDHLHNYDEDLTPEEQERARILYKNVYHRVDFFNEG